MISTRKLAAMLAGALVAVVAVAGPSSAVPKETETAMASSLAALVDDINALIGSDAADDAAQLAALEAVFAENGFSATEVTDLEQAIAAGGGMVYASRALSIVRLYGDDVCVGLLVPAKQKSWMVSLVTCRDQAAALNAAAGLSVLEAGKWVARSANVIAAVSPDPLGIVSAVHVWQAAREYRYAGAKMPKSWQSGRGVSRGPLGTIRAAGKTVFVLESVKRFATGGQSVCSIRLTIKSDGVLVAGSAVCLAG